jgi:hypothetical protein
VTFDDIVNYVEVTDLDEVGIHVGSIVGNCLLAMSGRWHTGTQIEI